MRICWIQFSGLNRNRFQGGEDGEFHVPRGWVIAKFCGGPWWVKDSSQVTKAGAQCRAKARLGDEMNIRLGLVALATFSLACGEEEPKNTAPPPASGSEQTASAPAVNTDFTKPVTLKPDDGGVVHVMANDAMKYNTNRIEVSGKSVKIELKHVGEMALETMGHNLVVLKAGTDVDAFLKASDEAEATGYIPGPDT